MAELTGKVSDFPQWHTRAQFKELDHSTRYDCQIKQLT
jgi:hypothetical protein